MYGVVNMLTSTVKSGQVIVGEGVKFERIRRITGYLTGDLNTWGNGKQAELKDRVKHVKSFETASGVAV